MQKVLTVAFAGSLTMIVALGVSLPGAGGAVADGGFHTNGHGWCC